MPLCLWHFLCSATFTFSPLVSPATVCCAYCTFHLETHRVRYAVDVTLSLTTAGLSRCFPRGDNGLASHRVILVPARSYLVSTANASWLVPGRESTPHPPLDPKAGRSYAERGNNVNDAEGHGTSLLRRIECASNFAIQRPRSSRVLRWCSKDCSSVTLLPPSESRAKWFGRSCSGSEHPQAPLNVDLSVR
ncbi:uncharacterized protein LOC143154860 [Ptiloglossa arizonensis]|uniref:uncharacterized protein LOC143154860 n=1 Tax=Ptiloglossa arizonensis TaxID=3350558 RepID=UPI003FA0C3B7